jgi:dTDP-4-dehydrorhamnose reductase
LLPHALALDHADLDVADPLATRAALAEADLVFNCAAYNAVDRAESEPEFAWRVNGEAPGLLAAACRDAGARLVHFSTNFVFDGSGERPWLESDEPRPLGAYARSKREGEVRVLDELPSALVIRTAGVFGRSGQGSASKGGSFVDRILQRAVAGDPLRVVDDQRLNPTYAAHLAAAAQAAAAAGRTGLLHLVAEGCCSWWELAVAALEAAGQAARAVERLSSEALTMAAPRPRNGCLASESWPPLPSWRQGVAEWAASRSRS